MPEPCSILLIVRKLDSGGCERDLAKIATGLDRGRFDVHVGCFIPEGIRQREIESAGIPVAVFPIQSFAPPTLLRAGRVFGDYVRRHRIRLVHAYDYPGSMFAVPAGKFYRVPAVLMSQLSHRDLRQAKERWVLRACDRLSDAIVVNCKAMERHMIEDEGVSPARLSLCYNGVDTGVFHARDRRRTAVLAGAGVVIGTICVLRPEKRIDLLIEAFARVHAIESSARLVIVGGGPLLAALRGQSDALGLGDSCRFEPATGAVAEWFRSMDIFALPSSSEAFSNALLEAMACGCAPVGSRVGGTPELIEDGERGFLFEAGSVEGLAAKLSILVKDAVLRQRFSEAAAAFASQTFPLERAVATMGQIYQRMLERQLL
jgi:glycosyltransferase involved in cell wall biosynthesis